MDLDAYIAEHDGEWRRLAYLSRKGHLTVGEADEIVMLYQRVSTHLSVVRSRMPDPLLVARLSALVLQARGAITGGVTRRSGGFRRFVMRTFPVAVYEARRWWIGTTAGFVVAAAIVAVYIVQNPGAAVALIGEVGVERLVFHDFESYYSEYQNQNFALKVWANNTWVGAQALAGGALILPALWVLWQNALNLGLTGGVMIAHDRSEVFFGLILPHGLLELGAIFLAGGVGLRIGWAWIAPPAGTTRGQAIGRAGRQGITVALGLIGVFGVAGLIEGFITPNFEAIVAIPVGVLALVGFVVYVWMLGRAGSAEGVTGDIESDLDRTVVLGRRESG